MFFSVKNIKPHLYFIAFLLIYVILGLYNLDTLPVTWTDEVQNLAPAMHLNKTGQFAAPMWPNPGAEKTFFSYMPLSILIHYPWLKLVGISVFKARLLYFIVTVIMLILLYTILKKKYKLSAFICVFFAALFVFDKCNFEILRSMRSEILELFLLLLLVWKFEYLKNPLKDAMVIGLISSLLFLSHLKVWPILPIIALYSIKLKWEFKYYILSFLVFLILPIMWLAYTGFDFHNLYQQMWVQGEKHVAGTISEMFYGNFIGRFSIYFPEQFILPCLHLIVFVVLIKKIKNWSIVEAMYFTLWVAWLLLLQPHHRYLPLLNLLGILILARSLQGLELKYFKLKWVSLLFLFIVSAPFFFRHGLAILQKRERNPEPFLSFIGSNIKGEGKTLLVGNSIGQYYAGTHKNTDYMIDFYPQHYQFSQYNQVYFITSDSLNLKSIACYSPLASSLGLKLKQRLPKGKGVTYAGNSIYVILSQKEWDMQFNKYLKY